MQKGEKGKGLFKCRRITLIEAEISKNEGGIPEVAAQLLLPVSVWQWQCLLFGL